MKGRPRDPVKAAAQAAGVKTYEGVPCPQGHTTRNTINGSCAMCNHKSNEDNRAIRRRRKRNEQQVQEFDAAPLAAAMGGWRG